MKGGNNAETKKQRAGASTFAVVLSVLFFVAGIVFFSTSRDGADSNGNNLKGSTLESDADDNNQNGSASSTCNPNDINLADYPQWQEEKGYWLGEYSLYDADGDPSSSSSWNYKYDHYKGFITGNIAGNKYRQRNFFMYPPQDPAECPFPNSTGAKDGSNPIGAGVCSTNGNMKVFWADQAKTKCSVPNIPMLGGDIEGPYGSLSYTYTELVGKDNALLYQVYMTKTALNFYEGAVLGNPYKRCTGGPTEWNCGYTEDRLMQSQLTTLTKLPSGQVLRTRTAQGFDAFGNVGATTYASYYRERKVTKEEFYKAFNETKAQYNILDSDTCAWKSGETGGTLPSGYSPGLNSCIEHLEESFILTPKPE